MSTKTVRKPDLNTEEIIRTVNAVKVISVLVLRNQGWADIRIRRFSQQFDDILDKVTNGRMTLSEIADIVHDETGLSLAELQVK